MTILIFALLLQVLHQDIEKVHQLLIQNCRRSFAPVCTGKKRPDAFSEEKLVHKAAQAVVVHLVYAVQCDAHHAKSGYPYGAGAKCH